MANDKKIIVNKRPRGNESGRDSPKSPGHIDVKKKRKFEDKTDKKLPKLRKSDERRQNTCFFGVCLTCYQYGDSTIGEISDFAYNHMCESSSGGDEEEKKKCIEALKNQIQKLENSSTSGAEARAKVHAMAKPTPPSPPPPSPSAVTLTPDK